MGGLGWIKKALRARARWALERSIRIGSLSGARWALANGAMLDEPSREPALCQALRHSPNPKEMCAELARLGAQAGRHSPLDGNAPLHLSFFCAHAPESALPIIQTLLAAGADPNARNRLGETPLTIAARERCWENWRARACEELLRGGADPERRGAKGLAAAELLAASLQEREASLAGVCAAGGGFMASSIAAWKDQEAESLARLRACFEAALLRQASEPTRLRSPEDKLRGKGERSRGRL